MQRTHADVCKSYIKLLFSDSRRIGNIPAV